MEAKSDWEGHLTLPRPSLHRACRSVLRRFHRTERRRGQESSESKRLLRKSCCTSSRAAIRQYAVGEPAADFASHKTFSTRFGNRNELVATLTMRVNHNDACAGLVVLPPVPKQPDDPALPRAGVRMEEPVYFLTTNNNHRIGSSEELERRVKQIRISLPDEEPPEHAVRSDDPSCIEAYQHRQFSERRAKAEWFHPIVARAQAYK